MPNKPEFFIFLNQIFQKGNIFSQCNNPNNKKELYLRAN